MLPKGDKIALVVKQNRSRCFLIIGVVAGVEDLNPWLLTWLYYPGSDTVSIKNQELKFISILKMIKVSYPEAPVPKSIAITWVKPESSFKKAICF